MTSIEEKLQRKPEGKSSDVRNSKLRFQPKSKVMRLSKWDMWQGE